MGNGKKLKDYTELLQEWDYELNGELNPLVFAAQSNQIVFWKCPNNHPSYQCSIDKRTTRKFGCPVCSNHKIIKGINDFETKHPELMIEWCWDKNNEIDILPSKLAPTSGSIVWWTCQTCGGRWKASISNRVRLNSGCPYCANLKVKQGYNDLLTLRPDLAQEWDYDKNELTPSEIVSQSAKKVWWKCEKGHSWLASPIRRAKNGCPICTNHKVLVGYNDFETHCPDAAQEWDYEKNNGTKPSQFTKSSEAQAWFKCEKGHSWRTKLLLRSRGSGCPYCSNKKTLSGYNDLSTIRPELIKEWDFDRNDVSPYHTNAMSNKKAWWICSSCGNSWSASIYTRTCGYGCPICGAKKATIGRLKKMANNNWIFDKYPTLYQEWDFEKNDNIIIELVTAASNQYVWWKCERGHSYKTRIVSRTLKGVGCPYCHNQKVLVGENDLETVNPNLAQEWDYEKNFPLLPSQVFSHGSRNVWWKCQICGYSWQAKINNRANGRGCPNCSLAGTSFIEQAIYYYIKQKFYDAKNRFKFNDEFELDIFVPSIMTAIEYDGSFYHSFDGADTREKNKDLFCKNNGIRLIRLREMPLKPTMDAENIICDCKSWGNLEQTINNLFDYLGIKEAPNISLKRDLPVIINSKKVLLKDKSIAHQCPYLAQEWDYEKNMPLVPEYFSVGSSVKVWWKCQVCDYSWKTAIYNRSHGTNCPNCFNKRRLQGLNKKH